MEKNEYTKKIKNYLKNMKYQLSLVYSKEDVRAIMDIIQEHVNIFLEQNPSASEENIKQCICEIGDFVQVGIENIDLHTLMQKIEVTNRAKKRKVYITAIAMTTIILFVVYCICDIIYTKSIAPAYVTETIVVLDETIYPDETDPTEFPSESSSESVE